MEQSFDPKKSFKIQFHIAFTVVLSNSEVTSIARVTIILSPQTNSPSGSSHWYDTETLLHTPIHFATVSRPVNKSNPIELGKKKIRPFILIHVGKLIFNLSTEYHSINEKQHF